MKKAASVSTVILVCLYLLLPIAKLFAFLKGYEMSIHGATAIASVLAVLSIWVTVGLLVWQEKMTSKVDQVLSAFSTLLFPFGFLHWGIFLPLSDWNIVGIIAAVLCLLCFAVLLFRTVQPMPMRVFSGFLALLVSLPVSLWVMIAPVFGDFGLSSVVAEASSPDGGYVAQVIYENRGMFGANTYVKVRSEKSEIDLLLLSFNRSPVRFTGNWGEKKDEVQLEWQDDETLLINGKAHSMAEEAEDANE